MSSTITETALPESPKKGIQALLQDARIDAAHSINGQDSDLMPAAISDSGIDSNIDSDIADSAEKVPVQAADEFPKDDIASEQLQRQAEQLAHFLRDRQRELDHREAQLNAEIAQLETDLRKRAVVLFRTGSRTGTAPSRVGHSGKGNLGAIGAIGRGRRRVET